MMLVISILLYLMIYWASLGPCWSLGYEIWICIGKTFAQNQQKWHWCNEHAQFEQVSTHWVRFKSYQKQTTKTRYVHARHTNTFIVLTVLMPHYPNVHAHYPNPNPNDFEHVLAYSIRNRLHISFLILREFRRIN